jgi:hypothetical protein
MTPRLLLAVHHNGRPGTLLGKTKSPGRLPETLGSTLISPPSCLRLRTAAVDEWPAASGLLVRVRPSSAGAWQQLAPPFSFLLVFPLFLLPRPGVARSRDRGVLPMAPWLRVVAGVDSLRPACDGEERRAAGPPYDFSLCRMDLPGPTTSVGTRTDYSVGPWDYPTCVARYLMV